MRQRMKGELVMDENFDIQAYMTRGVEKIVAASLKATLKDPRESAFMVKFAAASRRSFLTLFWTALQKGAANL